MADSDCSTDGRIRGVSQRRVDTKRTGRVHGHSDGSLSPTKYGDFGGTMISVGSDVPLACTLSSVHPKLDV